MSRWHPEYDSEELQSLESSEQHIETSLENIYDSIEKLETQASRLRAESALNEAKAYELVAEMRAQDEGITVAEALKREILRRNLEIAEAQRDRATRRMEAGHAQ